MPFAHVWSCNQIADYNADARNVGEFFEALLEFMKNLDAEQAA
jgi:hypothetical protein